MRPCAWHGAALPGGRCSSGPGSLKSAVVTTATVAPTRVVVVVVVVVAAGAGVCEGCRSCAPTQDASTSDGGRVWLGRRQ